LDRQSRLFLAYSLRAQPGTELPTPSRWTFAAALQASALCMSASLRHPAYARFHSSLEGIGSPVPSSFCCETAWRGFGLPTALRAGVCWQAQPGWRSV